MRHSSSKVWVAMFAATSGLLLAACSLLSPAKDAPIPPVKLVAVMPLERDELTTQPSVVGVEAAREPLPAGAEKVVTAQVYAVLAEAPRWRFVPDLTTESALRAIPSTDAVEVRAKKLADAVKSDAVLYGSVSRLREREGSEFGARNPASVSFKLAVYSSASAATVWRGQFDQTQEALSSNLLNWWQFWRGGPRWFTAAELARLGVEQLLGGFARRVQ